MRRGHLVEISMVNMNCGWPRHGTKTSYCYSPPLCLREASLWYIGPISEHLLSHTYFVRIYGYVGTSKQLMGCRERGAERTIAQFADRQAQAMGSKFSLPLVARSFSRALTSQFTTHPLTQGDSWIVHCPLTVLMWFGHPPVSLSYPIIHCPRTNLLLLACCFVYMSAGLEC